MKPKTYNIRTDEIKQNLLSEIKTIPTGKGFCVEIKTENQKRSNDQNKLYWVWIGALCAYGSGDKKEWHNKLKGKFFRGLLCEQDNDWVGFFDDADELYRETEHKKTVKKMVYGTMSTTTLTVKSFSAYLKLIDDYAISKGITLPIKSEFEYLDLRYKQ